MLMTISRWFFSLILLGLSSSIAMADSVDPKFVPIGGGGSIILNSPTDEAFQFSFTRGTDQTVDCGAHGGPSDDACINPANTRFVNNSGQTWISVTLEITQHNNAGGPALTFTALDNSIDPYFNNSTFGINEAGNPFVTFFGIDENHPGILPATSCTGFEIVTCTGPTEIFNDQTTLLYDFSILADVNEMTAGQSFTAQGTATVPEPATVLLALGGGLLFVFFKRT
jgi:hypothetical protein